MDKGEAFQQSPGRRSLAEVLVVIGLVLGLVLVVSELAVSVMGAL